jgi:hypothetical protein
MRSFLETKFYPREPQFQAVFPGMIAIDAIRQIGDSGDLRIHLQR